MGNEGGGGGGEILQNLKIFWNNINSNNLFLSATASRDKQILKCQSSASSSDK